MSCSMHILCPLHRARIQSYDIVLAFVACVCAKSEFLGSVGFEGTATDSADGFTWIQDVSINW